MAITKSHVGASPLHRCRSSCAPTSQDEGLRDPFLLRVHVCLCSSDGRGGWVECMCAGLSVWTLHLEAVRCCSRAPLVAYTGFMLTHATDTRITDQHTYTSVQKVIRPTLACAPVCVDQLWANKPVLTEMFPLTFTLSLRKAVCWILCCIYNFVKRGPDQNRILQFSALACLHAFHWMHEVWTSHNRRF